MINIKVKELEEFTAYAMNDNSIMITLEKGKNAIYLERNGKIGYDEWLKPKDVLAKLEKGNFNLDLVISK